VIYGAGGLGREVLAYLRAANSGKWNFLGFIDDGRPSGSRVSESEVLGNIAWLTSRTTSTAVLMGLADPAAKASRYAELSQNPFVTFPVLVHPLAHVDASAVLGAGTIISPYCSVLVDTTLGLCSFFNVGSMIGHDSVLGDFGSVMPHADILGNVTIGARTLVGAGAKILQGLSIGSDAIIGIGSVVLKDVPGRCTVLGYPARVIKVMEKSEMGKGEGE
jgi:sugar O-acyltransferase (sialic acid O-acetyltransferase NeuD family)